MNRKQKAEFVAGVLQTLFPQPAIPLQHKDTYTLLIAVLLSAQCTDRMVNRVTPELFALADTPKKMVELGVEGIQKIIRPCGLSPRKAKAIFELSHILISKYRGKVPSSGKALEALPGVGHKTASVVLSQGFSKPAFPVDTHILRCAQRWGLSKAKNVAGVEKDLKKIFPMKDWNKIHLQIIYFAREFCPALRHNEARCPICSVIYGHFSVNYSQ